MLTEQNSNEWSFVSYIHRLLKFTIILKSWVESGVVSQIWRINYVERKPIWHQTFNFVNFSNSNSKEFEKDVNKSGHFDVDEEDVPVNLESMDKWPHNRGGWRDRYFEKHVDYKHYDDCHFNAASGWICCSKLC